MSRFVSAGTYEEPTERDDAWLKAQQELDAKRLQKKVEAGKQEDGKSLYETLQANKAKKQEEFEEKLKLGNQFRALDEDEAEFLENVLESDRIKESALKKETRDQLEAFRRQQEEAEKAAGQEPQETAESVETWTAGSRKRKKGRESTINGVKLRRTSTAEKQSDASPSRSSSASSPAAKQGDTPVETERKTECTLKTVPAPSNSVDTAEEQEREPSTSKSSSPPTVGLGLAAYSSDEDD